MTSVFRPAIDRMAGYAPGEQPQEGGWVKLNTNENPYPPSPRVVDAIRRAAEGRLNVYPDPSAMGFRKVAAKLFNVDPDWILPGNGSDENLTIITRSFCDADQSIAYPYPSYVLYESLAQIQGSRVLRLRLNSKWQWDAAEAAELRKKIRIFFVPNPNSPTGTLWAAEQLAQLLPEQGVLVLDEAYGDFCQKPHRGELLRNDLFDGRMIVTRTFSKSYSLAGIRFGFAVAHPDLISGMLKVKDSYNCDTVAIAAAMRSATSFGVRFGAKMPNQTLVSKFSKPNSTMVGTSGSCLVRFAVVTASARSLPARISWFDEDTLSNIISIRPPMMSASAGPLPL